MKALPFRVKASLWGLAAVACLTSIFWVVELFTPDSRYERPDRGPVADITTPTTYEKQVAAQLRSDPVYIDPLMSAYAAEIIDDRVRAAVGAADFPTFLVALPSFAGLSPSGSEGVILARIIEEVGRDGIYFVLSPSNTLRHEVRDPRGPHIYIPSPREVDGTDVLRAIDTAEDELTRPEDKITDQPVVAGFLVGAMLSVPVWFLLKLVRRSARRDTSYLEGLR